MEAAEGGLTVIVCIQCSMRELLADRPSPAFDETMEQHLARCHPDLEATQRERQELERQLAKKLKAEGVPP